MSMSKWWFRTICVTLCICSATHVAEAKPDEASSEAEYAAATQAYDRGQEALEAGSFRAAAKWFEDAYERNPVPSILIKAAQAHRRAGNHSRAATLALTVLNDDQDPAATEEARKMVKRYRQKMSLVIVDCAGCQIQVDGTVQKESHFFVEANTLHRMVVEWSGGIRVRQIQGAPGEELAFGFADVAPVPLQADQGEGMSGRLTVALSQQASDSYLPPLATYIGLGVTTALLAASVAYTVNALNGVDDYQKAAGAYAACEMDCAAARERAESLLQDGRDLERMSSVSWTMTGIAATITAVVAFFLTDWEQEGSGDSGVRFGTYIRPQGPGTTLSLGMAL